MHSICKVRISPIWGRDLILTFLLLFWPCTGASGQKYSQRYTVRCRAALEIWHVGMRDIMIIESHARTVAESRCSARVNMGRQRLC